MSANAGRIILIFTGVLTMQIRKLASSLLAMVVLAAQITSAQQVKPPAKLSVYDAKTSGAIVGAEVSDQLTRLARITPNEGFVVLDFLTPVIGFYFIEVRMNGYAPREIKVREDTLKDLMIFLDPAPLGGDGSAKQLPVMLTTASFSLAADAGLRENFSNRCSVVSVTCIRDEEFASHPSSPIVYFLNKVSGVVPDCGSFTRSTLRTRRSTEEGSKTLDCIKMHGAGVKAAQLCVPIYYVDGAPHGFMESTLSEIEELFSASQVSGIEVYLSGQTTPLRFDGNPGCGSVVIWTKQI